MSKTSTHVSISPLLQKAFLVTSFLSLLVSFFIGMRLLLLAYPEFQGIRFSSLSLMAISSFALPAVSFLAFYFIALPVGRKLHRAFVSAIVSLIFVLIYEIFGRIAFAASAFPLFDTPLPITPYELIAAAVTASLLAAAVVITRMRHWISMPPTTLQLRALGGTLAGLFVVSQFTQMVLAHMGRTSVVGSMLLMTSVIFALSYTSARHRNSRLPFFQTTIAVAIAIQALLVVSAIYAIWSMI